MIEKTTRNLYAQDLLRHLQNDRKLDTSKMSGEEILDELFGERNDPGSFDAIDRYWEPKVKRVHRLNRLWVYPFTVLLSPIRYVLFGKVGWSDNTKIGLFILKITGYR